MRVPDIGPATDWGEALDGVTAVAHLAGLAHQVGLTVGPEDYERVNVAGTRGLATAARDASVHRFVFISSIGAVCSQSDTVVDERTPPEPDTAYGESKLRAERAVRAALRDTGTDWVILRPPLVYGPGNPGNMARLLKLVRTGLPLPFGAIRNRRSFIYVGNLVDAILHGLDSRGAARGTFVVSDGREVSTPELIRLLGTVAGYPARLIPVPVAGLRLMGRFGDGVRALAGYSVGFDSYSVDRLVGSLKVDASAFRDATGWEPPTEMEAGLKATFQAVPG